MTCPKSCTETRSIAPPSPRTSTDSSNKKKVGDEEKPFQSWSLRCFLLKKRAVNLKCLQINSKNTNQQINWFFLRCWSVVTNQPIWSTNPREILSFGPLLAPGPIGPLHPGSHAPRRGKNRRKDPALGCHQWRLPKNCKVGYQSL